MKYLVFLLLFSLTGAGCSIQKRLYTDGYYSDRSSKRGDAKKEAPVPDLLAVRKPGGSATENFDLSASLASTEPPAINKEPIGQICDTIYMDNGTKLLAAIGEINLRQIKYKLCDDQDGPLRISNKSSVSKICYAGGAKESFNTGNPDVQNRRSESGSDFTTARTGGSTNRIHDALTPRPSARS